MQIDDIVRFFKGHFIFYSEIMQILLCSNLSTSSSYWQYKMLSKNVRFLSLPAKELKFQDFQNDYH